MTERYGFGQVFIKHKRFRYGSGYLGDLYYVRESRAVVIVGWRNEYLGLVLESPEGLGMGYPVPVPLKACPYVAFALGVYSSLGFAAQSRPGLSSFFSFSSVCSRISKMSLTSFYGSLTSTPISDRNSFASFIEYLP